MTTLIRGTLLRDGCNARVEAWLDRAEQVLRAGGGDSARQGARGGFGERGAVPSLARRDLPSAEAALGALRLDDMNVAPGFAAARAVAEGLLRLIAGECSDAMRVAREALETVGTEGIHAYDAWLSAIAAVAR